MEVDWLEVQVLLLSQVVVQVFDNFGMVCEVQEKFNYFGFDIGMFDGQMGLCICSVIWVFQCSFGFLEIGNVD